jgi:hypothetical protein
MDMPILVRGSLARAVREVVEADDAILDCLARDVANLSAVARLIKPRIEARLGQPVREQSIVTVLKRLRGAARTQSRNNLKVLAHSSLDVRTDLAKLSVRASEEASEILQSQLGKLQRFIIQISWSPTAYTLVMDQHLLPRVAGLFSPGEILEKKEGLAAIIVHSPPELISTPGCISALTTKLARNNINIEDTVSTYTDTLLVVRMKDVVRAFTALNDLIAEARRVTESDKQ